MRKMFDRVFTRAADLLDQTERIAEDQLCIQSHNGWALPPLQSNGGKCQC